MGWAKLHENVFTRAHFFLGNQIFGNQIANHHSWHKCLFRCRKSETILSKHMLFFAFFFCLSATQISCKNIETCFLFSGAYQRVAKNFAKQRITAVATSKRRNITCFAASTTSQRKNNTESSCDLRFIFGTASGKRQRNFKYVRRIPRKLSSRRRRSKRTLVEDEDTATSQTVAENTRS